VDLPGMQAGVREGWDEMRVLMLLVLLVGGCQAASTCDRLLSSCSSRCHEAADVREAALCYRNCAEAYATCCNTEREPAR